MTLSKRQQQIIEESINIIDSKGIQGFTIKNLSKEIGISEPAIYRHFKSKTEILLTILESFREMAQMFNATMKTHSGIAIEKINLMFTMMLEMFSESPSLVSVIFSEEIFKNEEQLNNKILDIHNIHQSTIENIIEKGQSEKSVRTDIDKKSLALIIMGSLRLLVKRWDLNSYNFDLKEEGGELINSLKKIISK